MRRQLLVKGIFISSQKDFFPNPELPKPTQKEKETKQTIEELKSKCNVLKAMENPEQNSIGGDREKTNTKRNYQILHIEDIDGTIDMPSKPEPEKPIDGMIFLEILSFLIFRSFESCMYVGNFIYFVKIFHTSCSCFKSPKYPFFKISRYISPIDYKP